MSLGLWVNNKVFITMDWKKFIVEFIRVLLAVLSGIGGGMLAA